MVAGKLSLAIGLGFCWAATPASRWGNLTFLNSNQNSITFIWSAGGFGVPPMLSAASWRRLVGSSCTTRGPAHRVSCFASCRVLHACKGYLQLAQICGTPPTLTVPCCTVGQSQARVHCAHVGWSRSSTPTSHPTEPLVQSRHQLFHLRTDVECKVFLVS